MVPSVIPPHTPSRCDLRWAMARQAVFFLTWLKYGQASIRVSKYHLAFLERVPTKEADIREKAVGVFMNGDP